MPEPKWSNYKISNNIDGSIVIGKLETKQPIPGLDFFSSKSEDRTEECLKAAMNYLNSQVKEGDDSIKVGLLGIGTLTWQKERTDEDE